MPLVNNTHNGLLKKQKRTRSSLAIRNNSQYTDKQVLEYMLFELPKNCSLFAFFQTASNLLCRVSRLLVCTVPSDNKHKQKSLSAEKSDSKKELKNFLFPYQCLQKGDLGGNKIPALLLRLTQQESASQNSFKKTENLKSKQNSGQLQ